MNEAVNAAKQNRAELDAELFDFLGAGVLLKVRGVKETEFVERFQQFTGPAMAKGVEDTTFYNYDRLISLNEVGGDPGVFGVSTQEFPRLVCRDPRRRIHAPCLRPQRMTRSAAKTFGRGSACFPKSPKQWEAALTRWRDMNAGLKQDGAPDPNTEYFLYQTLIGTWPIGLDRLLPVHGESLPRSKGAHLLAIAQQEFRRRDKGFHRRAVQKRAVSERLSKALSSRSSSPGALTLWRCCCLNLPLLVFLTCIKERSCGILAL